MSDKPLVIMFPKPITVNLGETIKITYNQNLSTGEITEIQTEIIKVEEEEYDEEGEDRPIKLTFHDGSTLGESSGNS